MLIVDSTIRRIGVHGHAGERRLFMLEREVAAVVEYYRKTLKELGYCDEIIKRRIGRVTAYGPDFNAVGMDMQALNTLRKELRDAEYTQGNPFVRICSEKSDESDQAAENLEKAEKAYRDIIARVAERADVRIEKVVSEAKEEQPESSENPETESPEIQERPEVFDKSREAVEQYDEQDESEEEEPQIPSAKELYDYLNTRVWKQDDAKRAAAILVHNVLSGRRQNMMFAGPSGCGKTFIWKQLAEKLNPIYPHLITVFDGSSVTTEGFKGQQKWGTIVGRREFADGMPHILIIDEADKFISPKFTSSGENVSVTLMSEALKTMEGAVIDVAGRREALKLDCNKISFVFCGAFSRKAEDIAEKESGSSMGFLASNNKVEAYARKLEVKDIIEFGAMPEFMGRIERIVNLEPMGEDDFYNILMDSNMGPIKELQDLYGIEITISKDRVVELAKIARDNKLGMRAIRNLLRAEVDELLFEDESASVACL